MDAVSGANSGRCRRLTPMGHLPVDFMNPVPLMQLLEITRGLRTSDDTYAATALAEQMGKTTSRSLTLRPATWRAGVTRAWSSLAKMGAR